MDNYWYDEIIRLVFEGEAICSVYIQPEGFGPPPKQGHKDYQQRYSQTIDKRFVNGSTTTTTTTIEDFKVIIFHYFLLFEFCSILYIHMFQYYFRWIHSSTDCCVRPNSANQLRVVTLARQIRKCQLQLIAV